MEEELRNQMLKVDFYPHRPPYVREIQTHISHVFLAPPYVYKVKKPVDFGFLDFTTLARRCFFTHRELYLNSRFSPNLYLDVLPITRDGEAYRLGGEGDPVEYVLVMRQFNEERTMKRLIANGELTEKDVVALAKRLANIHRGSHRIAVDRGLGTYASVRYDCEENFDQLAPYTRQFIDKEVWGHVREATLGFLDDHEELFHLRHRKGFIRDCHGDLHTEHIIFEEGKILIFDCIEFNERFRYIDITSDLAFLVMELAFLGQKEYLSPLVDTYFSRLEDKWGGLLLDFYAAYRATVRAKVNAFVAGDDTVPMEQRERSKTVAQTYLRLAEDFLRRYRRPWLILVMGFSGTGKTTVASILEKEAPLTVFHSDVIRKEIQRGGEETAGRWNEGMYRPEKKAQVYEKMFEGASALLRRGRHVCLDASFLDAPQREKAWALAETQGVNFLAIECRCAEEQIERYLKERASKGTDASDADFSIYLRQKEMFDGWAPFPPSQRFPLETTRGIPTEELALLAAYVKG